MRRTILLALSVSACGPESVTAQGGVQRSELHDFRIDTVVTGLAHPWGLAFLPDGALLVTERGGQLRMVVDGRLVPEPVQGTPEVAARDQGGLLDVALHPRFADTRWVYLSYAKPGPEGITTAVSRGRLDGMRLTDVQEIFEARAWRSGGPHFGSRLVFDRAGYLYVTVGDRGAMQEAQNRGNHQGTILRLHDDGRVPDDNPFVGQAGVLPEIFSYGHRNPQGLALHPETGELWSTEHGARGGDELNHVRAGRNYGWPVITHGINYNGQPIGEGTSKPGMEQPVHYWVPSIATSGTTIYAGDRFPRWRGSILVGGLTGQQLVRISVDGTRETGSEVLFRGMGRVRDVRTGPDGFIYVLIDAPAAPLLRLEPAR